MSTCKNLTTKMIDGITSSSNVQATICACFVVKVKLINADINKNRELSDKGICNKHQNTNLMEWKNANQQQTTKGKDPFLVDVLFSG